MDKSVIIEKVTSDNHRTQNGIHKSELTTLMPKACVVGLQHLLGVLQNVLRDGEVTKGESMRIMNAMNRSGLLIAAEGKKMEMKARGFCLQGKSGPAKTLDRSLESVTPVVDADELNLVL